MSQYEDVIRRSAFIFIVVTIAIFILLLQGCVYATYNAEQGKESLKVISLLKEVDGFSADRNAEEFNIEIDKTRGDDPFEGLADLLDSWNELQSMGLYYSPPEEVSNAID